MSLKDIPLAPSWSTRFHYYHHSNASKDLSKVFIEKVFIRPKVDAAWGVIRSKESSHEQKEHAFALLDILDQKRNGSQSVVMMSGILVQSAVNRILVENWPSEKAIEEGIEALESYRSRTWDQGSDEARKAVCKEEFSDLVKNAVKGVEETLSQENRIFGERELFGKIPGLEIPYLTYPDFNNFLDLKTKWSKPAETKSGVRAASLPKTLNGIFDQRNVYQICGFYMLSGRLPSLLYVNKSDYRILNANNCYQLTKEYLDDLSQVIIEKLQSIEFKLRVAKDRYDLIRMETPDFQSIDWKEPPVYVDYIKKIKTDALEQNIKLQKVMEEMNAT